MSRKMAVMPIPVRRAVRKLGADIRDARRRRRLPMSVVAERAQISRPTLHRIERGDPGVSFGGYATVLFVLGLGDWPALIADASIDQIGLALEEERLPQRIRMTRSEALGVS